MKPIDELNRDRLAAFPLGFPSLISGRLKSLRYDASGVLKRAPLKALVDKRFHFRPGNLNGQGAASLPSLSPTLAFARRHWRKCCYINSSLLLQAVTLIRR